ncbi:MAG: M42 family metallopeptidase [Bacteroidales bacterium]|jgi:putative aminopeptidase FrvX|nr:M42 family metallopeptidase [Bacteroidales bacterium]
MSLNFPLLKKLSETPGAPGFEDKISELIISEITPLVDSISIDNMGNIHAFKKGKTNKKVMLAAHMDEIGFIVTHIDDNGFLKFAPLGGFDPKTLTAQRVIVHGKEDIVGVMGSKPIHVMTPEEREKKVKLTDYFIDLGRSKEEVENLVEIGTPITRQRELIEMGECVNGKSLDNRISVYVLIETLKLLQKKEIPFDTYAVFTTQEEVGLRGAQVATIQIQPDIAFAIDTTIAFDLPGSTSSDYVTKLGKGPAIKIMDASVVTNPRLVAFMKQTADAADIPWQPEILQAGGTDTAMLQKMVAGGAIAGAVSIPTRHLHQVIESSHKKDVEYAVQLLTSIVEKIDSFSVRL